MSTEIARATDVLPSREEVAHQLDQLEASGDTQALNEVARMARAYQEYEARAGATERANHFGRIKVMAEARIGSIDLDLHPKPGQAMLEFDGVAVPRSRRDQWRMLGGGLQTGQLDKAMTLAESRADAVHTSSVARELRQMGVLMVWTAPLLKRYHELYRRDMLTVSEVERRAGVSSASHFLTRPGTTPQHDKAARPVAIRVANVLGVDPKTLKNAPQRRKPKRTRPLRRARKLTGGRLDETYSLIRKALQELDRAAGQGDRWGTAEAWDHLYAAEEVVGKALKRAPSDVR